MEINMSKNAVLIQSNELTCLTIYIFQASLPAMLSQKQRLGMPQVSATPRRAAHVS